MLTAILNNLSFLLNKYVLGGILVASLFFYFNYLHSSIEKLEKDKAVVEKYLEETKQREKEYESNYRKSVEFNAGLNKQKTELQKEASKLRSMLDREIDTNKKSLNDLSIAKPSLIQKKINKATKDVLECIEIASKGYKCVN